MIFGRLFPHWTEHPGLTLSICGRSSPSVRRLRQIFRSFGDVLSGSSFPAEVHVVKRLKDNGANSEQKVERCLRGKGSVQVVTNDAQDESSDYQAVDETTDVKEDISSPCYTWI